MVGPRLRSRRPSRNRLVIGSRRSRPNALIEIFGPGADWRRLYSAAVDHAQHPVDQRRVVAGRDQVVPAQVAVDVPGQDRVELRVVGQRVGVELPRAAARRWAAW